MNSSAYQPETKWPSLMWVSPNGSPLYWVTGIRYLPLGVMFEEMVAEEDVRFTIGEGRTCRSRIEVSIDSIRRFFRFKKQYRFYGLHMCSRPKTSFSVKNRPFFNNQIGLFWTKTVYLGPKRRFFGQISLIWSKKVFFDQNW